MLALNHAISTNMSQMEVALSTGINLLMSSCRKLFGIAEASQEIVMSFFLEMNKCNMETSCSLHLMFSTSNDIQTLMHSSWLYSYQSQVT